jgi:hypothetical protein
MIDVSIHNVSLEIIMFVLNLGNKLSLVVRRVSNIGIYIYIFIYYTRKLKIEQYKPAKTGGWIQVLRKGKQSCSTSGICRVRNIPVFSTYKSVSVIYILPPYILNLSLFPEGQLSW